MLKRILAGLLCLLLLPLGVSAEEAAAGPVMEKKTFPHLYVYDKTGWWISWTFRIPGKMSWISKP